MKTSPDLNWYDSPDPSRRYEALTLFLSRPDAQRGTLCHATRENPAGGPWSTTTIGRGYSRVSAAKHAHARGLVQDGYDAPAGTQREAIERALAAGSVAA